MTGDPAPASCDRAAERRRALSGMGSRLEHDPEQVGVPDLVRAAFATATSTTQRHLAWAVAEALDDPDGTRRPPRRRPRAAPSGGWERVRWLIANRSVERHLVEASGAFLMAALAAAAPDAVRAALRRRGLGEGSDPLHRPRHHRREGPGAIVFGSEERRRTAPMLMRAFAIATVHDALILWGGHERIAAEARGFVTDDRWLFWNRVRTLAPRSVVQACAAIERAHTAAAQHTVASPLLHPFVGGPALAELGWIHTADRYHQEVALDHPERRRNEHRYAQRLANLLLHRARALLGWDDAVDIAEPTDDAFEKAAPDTRAALVHHALAEASVVPRRAPTEAERRRAEQAIPTLLFGGCGGGAPDDLWAALLGVAALAKVAAPSDNAAAWCDAQAQAVVRKATEGPCPNGPIGGGPRGATWMSAWWFMATAPTRLALGPTVLEADAAHGGRHVFLMASVLVDDANALRAAVGGRAFDALADLDLEEVRAAITALHHKPSTTRPLERALVDRLVLAATAASGAVRGPAVTAPAPPVRKM